LRSARPRPTRDGYRERHSVEELVKAAEGLKKK
jgi:hypothetical protein